MAEGKPPQVTSEGVLRYCVCEGPVVQSVTRPLCLQSQKLCWALGMEAGPLHLPWAPTGPSLSLATALGNSQHVSDIFDDLVFGW